MAKVTELQVNGARYPVEADEATPLLVVLRDQLGLTGTKYGCGEASAAPARCWWTATRAAPARLRSERPPAARLPPSRASHETAASTLSSKLSSTPRPSSAATALLE